MRKISKIFTVLLSALLALCCAFSAGAAVLIEAEDFQFELTEDNTYKITKYKLDDPTMVIPDSYGSRKIVSIVPYAFENDSVIEHIVFGSNFTSVGVCAFKGSTALRDVTLPETLTALNWSAFQNCTALTDVNILKSGVTSVPDHCFYGCTALKNVTIGSSITTLERYSFADCTSLEYVFIPDSVTSIDPTAFDNCPSLKIYCYPDSYALTYAEENGVPYELVDKADKTALNEAVASAVELLSDTFGYAPETLDNITALLASAQLLSDDKSASQESVDEAASALSQALTSAVRYQNGDVDLDGVISIKDASNIQLYLAKLTKLSDFQLSLGDYNCDGEFDLFDATYIQLVNAKLIKL